ncbi:hypothetical protein JTE90_000623 [Oedothorax gibbosus]|uniref:Uncharacterized protein n=1 Tax=Oedothorax gibbosus TaxID=931172 RepID=A0AAV6VVB2_9ARAC|nr:hypothetical protein JTE90_000623 [Oedothorax gibbosus]
MADFNFKRQGVVDSFYKLELENRLQLVLKRYIPTFHGEISCMMYTHGDVQEPLSETVLLMGTVLRDQMNILLKQATECGPKRKKGSFTHENILPLLLKNKRKLKRLLRYLTMGDVRENVFKKKPIVAVADLIDGVEHGKKVKTCLTCLQKMDPSFDIKEIMDNSVPDPVIAKRQQRRYLITYHLNQEDYLDFSEKLQASFCPKGDNELFKKWLLLDNMTHLTPSNLAMEIINFLALETVAEIVDLCLWLKYNRNTDEKNNFNIDYKDPSTNLDFNLLSQNFGDEFKEGVEKKPITPDNIREALNIASGIHGYRYNVHWKTAKKPKLLCVQDNDPNSLFA